LPLESRTSLACTLMICAIFIAILIERFYGTKKRDKVYNNSLSLS